MKEQRLYEFSLFAGMISAIVYLLHVIVGGILWKGYSHIEQAISDLTSIDAPNRLLLLVMTNVYGILAVIFAIALYRLLKQRRSKVLDYGLILLIIMEVVSFIGYLLFPLESSGMEIASFQNTMHIVVTIVVVVATIGSTFLLGFAFLRIQGMKRLGLFIILCGITIIISGAFTGIVIANELPITGLVERINIFTLQSMIFVLSYVMYREYKDKGNLKLS